MSAEATIAVLVATLPAIGWALWVLPVGPGAQRQVVKAVRARVTDAPLGRGHGTPSSPGCGRHHRRGEDHRA